MVKACEEYYFENGEEDIESEYEYEEVDCNPQSKKIGSCLTQSCKMYIYIYTSVS